MDVSKEYIEMCERAEELQHHWFIWGDYFKPLDFKAVCLDVEGKGYKPDNYIWLPRQDQLQEMLKDKYSWSNNFSHHLIWDFSSFVQDHGRIQSMEQLWLAFVMSEKYSKHWDGNDWVKKGAV